MTLTGDIVHDSAFTSPYLSFAFLDALVWILCCLKETKVRFQCVFRLGEDDQMNMAKKPTSANVSK